MGVWLLLAPPPLMMTPLIPMGEACLGVMNWGDISCETVFLKAESPMLTLRGVLSCFVRLGGAFVRFAVSLLAVFGRFLAMCLCVI